MFGKKSQEDTLNTVVGKGSIMEGHFEVADGIRVDGVLRGKITTTGSLIVGTEGQIDIFEYNTKTRQCWRVFFWPNLSLLSYYTGLWYRPLGKSLWALCWLSLTSMRTSLPSYSVFKISPMR